MTGKTASDSVPLGRFYTNPFVSDVLVNSMHAEPDRIIDLGSGAGSLTLAALRRWRSAEIVTVDIDQSVGRYRDHADAQKPLHTHITADVLDFDLPTRLPGASRKFDAAVCNPPYISAKWTTSCEGILEEAGLSCVLRHGRMLGADVLFLAQNLRLIRDGGKVGLIVPDGVITGVRHSPIREQLLNYHCVESVIQLPRGCFRATDAQAFILVLTKKEKQKSTIELRCLEDRGTLSCSIKIPAESAVTRCDYRYYATRPKSVGRVVTLQGVGANVVRGTLNSAEAKHSGLLYLHTSDLPISGKKVLKLPRNPTKLSTRKLTLAEPGDILIARIGRNLHLKVALVKSGRIALTDCVFRIRIPKAWRQRVFESLKSRRGSQGLDAIVRGVGAKTFNKDDLMRLELSI